MEERADREGEEVREKKEEMEEKIRLLEERVKAFKEGGEGSSLPLRGRRGEGKGRSWIAEGES